MLIPRDVRDFTEVTFDSQLWLPLLGLRISLPLMHGTTISIC